jgi:hypothetical protein
VIVIPVYGAKETYAPSRKFSPEMVSSTVLPSSPELGLIVVIAGDGYFSCANTKEVPINRINKTALIPVQHTLLFIFILLDA